MHRERPVPIETGTGLVRQYSTRPSSPRNNCGRRAAMQRCRGIHRRGRRRTRRSRRRRGRFLTRVAGILGALAYSGPRPWSHSIAQMSVPSSWPVGQHVSASSPIAWRAASPSG